MTLMIVDAKDVLADEPRWWVDPGSDGLWELDHVACGAGRLHTMPRTVFRPDEISHAIVDRPTPAKRTRHHAAAKIVGHLRELLHDLGRTDVTVTTSRGPRIAAVGGDPVVRVTIEIEVSAPDEDET